MFDIWDCELIRAASPAYNAKCYFWVLPDTEERTKSIFTCSQNRAESKFSNDAKLYPTTDTKSQIFLVNMILFRFFSRTWDSLLPKKPHHHPTFWVAKQALLCAIAKQRSFHNTAAVLWSSPLGIRWSCWSSWCGSVESRRSKSAAWPLTPHTACEGYFLSFV